MIEEINKNPLDESSINCPVILQFDVLLRSIEESLRALRRFQRNMMNCRICPEIINCELLEEMNLQIDEVIAEIVEKWGW